MKTIVIPFLFLVPGLFFACKTTQNSPSDPEGGNKPAVVSLPLIGTTWLLIELEGKMITEMKQPGTAPYLEIYDDSTFAAEDGCSRITGTVRISDGNRIKFENLVSSMNACPGQTLEAAFKRALVNCDNYSIQGSTMGMQKAKMAPFARFKAAVGQEP